MEVDRQLDVLDRQLADNQFIAADDYTIADMAIWPWYGNGMVTASPTTTRARSCRRTTIKT